MKWSFHLLLVVICVIAPACDRRPADHKRLCEALKGGDTSLLKKYLASGGDVNKSIRYERSGYFFAPMIDLAVQNGQLKCAELLLKSGASANKRDSQGFTPLGWAIGQISNEVPRQTQLAMFELLLNSGADANLKVLDADLEVAYSTLHYASFLGKREMVKMLLVAGVDVNATNRDGVSALHVAGNADVARELIASGARPDARTRAGKTPAETAVDLRRFEVLAVLTNAAAR